LHVETNPYFNPDVNALPFSTQHQAKGQRTSIIDDGTLDTILVHPREDVSEARS